MALKQLNMKNRTYYFYNDLINIKDFNARSLKLDKKHQWVLTCNAMYLNAMLIV